MIHASAIALFSSTFQASLLIAAVLLVRVLSRHRLPANLLGAMWILVLLRLLIPVSIESPWSLAALFAGGEKSASAPITQIIYSTISTPTQSATPEPTATAPLIHHLNVANVAIAIWLTVTALLLLRVLIGQFFLNRALRTRAIDVTDEFSALLDRCRAQAGVGRHVRVIRTNLVSTPAVTGFFKPTILLPANRAAPFTDHEIRLIFLHELAHVRRLDLLWNFLAAIVCAIHWFNPLVWLARKSAELDRELAADGAVLKQLQTSERQHYGLTLLAVSTSPRPSLLLAAAIGESGSRLTLRLRRVNDSPRVSLLTALLASLFIFAVGCASFTKASPPTSDHSSSTNTRIYDVGEFLTNRPAPVAVVDGAAAAPATAPAPTASPALRAERMNAIIDGITSTIAPKSWGVIGSIHPYKDRMIMVTQTDENQEKIADFLDNLRAARGLTIRIQTRFIQAPANFDIGRDLPAGGGVAGAFLDDKSVNDLLRRVQDSKEASQISAPRLIVHNGERATIQIGQDISYVADVGPGGTPKDIKPAVVNTGIFLDCQATVSADHKYITISLKPKSINLLEMRNIPAPSNPKEFAQIPITANWKYETTVSVPDNGTILLNVPGPQYLPAGERPTKQQSLSHVLLLTTARILNPTTMPVK